MLDNIGDAHIWAYYRYRHPLPPYAIVPRTDPRRAGIVFDFHEYPVGGRMGERYDRSDIYQRCNWDLP